MDVLFCLYSLGPRVPLLTNERFSPVFKLFTPLAAWAIFLLLLSLSPSPPHFDSIIGWDKLQHAGAFAIFTFLAGRAFAVVSSLSHRPWWLAAIAAIIFGGCIEILQEFFTTTRKAEIADLLADAVGAGIVYLIARMRKPKSFLPPLLMAMLLIPVMNSQAQAGEEKSTFAGTLAEEAVRLKDESLEVVTTPVDTKGYGFLGTLAVGGAVGFTYLFDEEIRENVQGKRGATLDTAADIGGIVGNPLLHLGIAGTVYGGGVLADSPKWRETGLMMGEAALLADATSFVLKQATGRGRPFAANDKGSFRPFQFSSDYDSLPSMHTASSFAMASVLASTSENPGPKLLYYTVATFVGFSRIYEDKHWASDIVLGAAVGELCGRVVKKYHGSQYKIAIVPVFDGKSASVSLACKW